MKTLPVLAVVLLFPFFAVGQTTFQSLLDDIDTQGQQALQDQKKLTDKTLPSEQKTDVQRDYQSHVDKIVQLGQTQPQSQPVNLEAGKKLFEVGESKQAAPFADQSVNLARQSGDSKALHDSLLTQARIRFDLKDYSGVVADAEELLKRDPSDQAALRLRSMAANRTTAGSRGPAAPGQPRGGETPPGGRPTAISPQAQSIPIAAAPSSAEQALLAGAARTSRQLESRRLAQEASGRMGLDAAAAQALLDKAIKLDPQDALAYALRSRAELAGGSAEAAFADADRAAALDQRSAAAYEARAQAGLKLGKPARQALGDLKAAAELDPAFGPEYEKALAQYGAASGSARPLQAAPDGWPALVRSLRGRGAFLGLCAAAAAVLGAWIALLLRWRRPSDRQ